MFCVITVAGTMASSATAPSVATLKLFHGMNLAGSVAPAVMQRYSFILQFFFKRSKFVV